MTRQRPWRAAAIAAACMLVLAVATACGSHAPGHDASATLEVASFPAADIWIDGTWKGSTPISISVSPGTHELRLMQDGFEEHKESVDVAAGGRVTREAVLVARDVDNPKVLAQLARPFDIAMEPFEAPETHRGSRKSPPVVLLWPQKDVRTVGLSTFAIEVSEEYEGDGFLVFRKGRDVLYREAFDPDQMTTVARIPVSVLEALNPGDRVTWGVVYESRRERPVETTFDVVRRPKADHAIEKMAKDRYLLRQPKVARDLLAAQALENYRLYTEALVARLDILQDNPTSTEPYRGIVTTLRRLGAKDSRLWSLASQFVAGGGRGRAGRTGIAAFSPRTPAGAPPSTLPPSTLPPAVAGTPGGRGLGAGDSILPGLRSGSSPSGATAPSTSAPTPPSGTSEEPPAKSPVAAKPGAKSGPDENPLPPDGAVPPEGAPSPADIAARAQQAAEDAGHALQAAQDNVDRANDALQQAEQSAAADPSPENQQKLEDARQALQDARATEHEAEQYASDLQARAEAARQAAEAAAAAKGAPPSGAPDTPPAAPEGTPPAATPPAPSAPGAPDPAQSQRSEDDYQAQLTTARTAVDDAQAAVEQASRDLQQNPDDADAQAQHEQALQRLSEAQKALDALVSAYQDAHGGDPEGAGR